MNDTYFHEDKDLFSAALDYTGKISGFSSRLVEKDYYCSVLLEYFYKNPSSPLLFKGGTCLSKIYTDFYRLSEDLDFVISVKVGDTRIARRKKITPVKSLVENIPSKLPVFKLPEKLRGHNQSRQYIAYVEYTSAITGRPEGIKIEIGLREEVILPSMKGNAKTLLTDPFSKEAAISHFPLHSLSRDEVYAEKVRAALCRREPAIRDFFDIDYAVAKGSIDLDDSHIIELICKKLSVPGNEPIDISPSRKDLLYIQIKPQLKPVLRPEDFQNFDLDRVFELISKTGNIFRKRT